MSLAGLRRVPVIALLGLAAPLAAAASPVPAASPTPSPLAPFGWLAELAGACWTGAWPDGKTRDTQCYSVQYGRYLRGTIRLTRAEAEGRESSFEGDGLFAWDAKLGQLVFWGWTDGGSLSTGTFSLDGPLVRFPQAREPGSTRPETRSTWSRLDRDSYKVVREQREGEGWKELFAVVYRRDPARP